MIDEFFVLYAWKFAPVTFKECGEWEHAWKF